jgi:hypothetical protein
MADQKPDPDWADILGTLGIDPERTLSEFLEPEICAAIPGLGDLTVREAFSFESIRDAFKRRYELHILGTGHC